MNGSEPYMRCKKSYTIICIRFLWLFCGCFVVVLWLFCGCFVRFNSHNRCSHRILVRTCAYWSCSRSERPGKDLHRTDSWQP